MKNNKKTQKKPILTLEDESKLTSFDPAAGTLVLAGVVFMNHKNKTELNSSCGRTIVLPKTPEGVWTLRHNNRIIATSKNLSRLAQWMPKSF